MNRNTVFAALVALSLSSGGIFTLWTYDWRYLVTGALVSFFLAVVAGNLQKD